MINYKPVWLGWCVSETSNIRLLSTKFTRRDEKSTWCPKTRPPIYTQDRNHIYVYVRIYKLISDQVNHSRK